MAITTFDQLVIAYSQKLRYFKTNTVTTVAGAYYSLFDRAGFPIAGSLNPGNVASGIVPVSGNTGYPTIQAPQGANKLYLRALWGNVSTNLIVYINDVLFTAGATTIPTTGSTVVTLTAPPAFTNRVPFKGDGTTRDYSLVNLYVIASTATGAQAHSVRVNYLDQDGNPDVTPAVSTQSLTINRMLPLPLAVGDTGVSAITGYTVIGATSATGTVSIIAMREIAAIRPTLSAFYGPDYTQVPELFATSALLAMVSPDSTSSGVIDLRLEIAHG